MRIAIVTNNPDFFLSHRLSWGRRLLALGHEVVVITPDGENASRVRGEGFKLYPVFVDRKGVNPFNELRSLASHIAAIQKAKPDFILNFTLKSIVYGTLSGHLLGVPKVVNTFTGFGTVFIQDKALYEWIRKGLTFLFRTVFKSPRVHCVFQNYDDAKYALLRGWCSREQTSVIVGSGVELDAYEYVPEKDANRVKILFPSRLLYDKGIKELVSACEVLSHRGLKFELLVAGDVDSGNASAVSKSDIRKWRTLKFIKFLGHCSDMPALYQASHIVCLPSYREGAPKSLIEACAAGRPIVTTNVPGCREVVRNGVNGLLVPRYSSTELADALEALIQNPHMRIRFGKAGRERAEQEFDIKFVLARFVLETGIEPLKSKEEVA